MYVILPCWRLTRRRLLGLVEFGDQRAFRLPLRVQPGCLAPRIGNHGLDRGAALGQAFAGDGGKLGLQALQPAFGIFQGSRRRRPCDGDGRARRIEKAHAFVR